MPDLHAVIFDLDDTLLDHRAAATAGVKQWLTALGVTPTDELVELWFVAEKRYFDRAAAGEITVEEHRRRRVATMLNHLRRPLGADPELEAMFADYLSGYERHWRAFDDVPGAIEAVERTGLKLAVLTNGTAEQQARKLAAIGLARLQDRLFAATATGLSKPDPRAYLDVCERIGSSPGQTLHVGDREDLDYEAPKAAGLLAIQIDRTAPDSTTTRIRSLAELAGRLR